MLTRHHRHLSKPDPSWPDMTICSRHALCVSCCVPTLQPMLHRQLGKACLCCSVLLLLSPPFSALWCYVVPQGLLFSAQNDCFSILCPISCSVNAASGMEAGILTDSAHPVHAEPTKNDLTAVSFSITLRVTCSHKASYASLSTRAAMIAQYERL